MKIKNKFKRTLSVLIAAALLAVTATPMSLFSVSAAESEAVPAAVDNLKTAWKDLQHKKEEMYFFQYADNNGTKTEKNDIATTPVNDAEEQKMVGTVCKQFNIDSTYSFDGGKNRIVFENSGTNSPKIDTISDILLTYKIDGVTTGTLQIEMKLTSPKSKQYSAYSNLVADGVWHTIRVSELIGDNWQETVDQSWQKAEDSSKELWRIFVNHNVMTATITYGVPVILEDGGAYPTEDTADWTAAEWYSKAAQVNADNYYFGDAFKTALAELAEVLDEEETIAQLRNVSFITKKTEFNNLYKFENGSSSNNTTDVTVNDLSENDDQKIVGSKTRTFNINSAESFGDLNRIIFQGSSNLSLDDIEDIILSYRVDEVKSGETNISLGVASNGWKIYKEISANTTIALENDKQWHTVKISECLGSDWKNTVYNSIIWKENESNRKLMWLVIYSDVMEAKITYGTPIILQNSGVATGTEEWTGKDWYNAANEAYNDLYGDQNFITARNALHQKYGQLAQISKIAAAYGNLGTKDYAELVYEKYKDSSSGDKDNGNCNLSTTLPAGIEGIEDTINAEKLGSKWKQVPVESTSAYSYQGMVILNDGGNGKKIEELADGEIWYRVDNVADGSASPKVKIQLVSVDSKTSEDSNEIALEADKKWHCFKISDGFGEDWNKTVSTTWTNNSTNNSTLYRIFIKSNVTKSTITYGSMRLSQKQSVDTSLWTLADWIDNVDALDSAKYFESNVNAVKAIADKVKKCEFVKIGDANFDQNVNILDLVRAKKYLSDSSTKIFKYAAKMNQDKVGSASLVELRKLLLDQ